MALKRARERVPGSVDCLEEIWFGLKRTIYITNTVYNRERLLRRLIPHRTRTQLDNIEVKCNGTGNRVNGRFNKTEQPVLRSRISPPPGGPIPLEVIGFTWQDSISTPCFRQRKLLHFRNDAMERVHVIVSSESLVSSFLVAEAAYRPIDKKCTGHHERPENLHGCPGALVHLPKWVPLLGETKHK